MISNTLTATRLVLLAPLLWLLSQTGAAERWAALGVLLMAGLTDILDGRVARALGEVSRTGALLDLVADRLLSLTVVAGLLASGELPGGWVAAGVALIARDLTVASFGEAAPGLGIKVSALERVKIALQFAAFGLLCAPRVVTIVDQYEAGRWLLGASATLAAITVALYARRVGPKLA
jgi:phosphatidylglycerophosphate synthase